MKTIAVLGSFRGGTSLVAGLLHRLGVSMGPELKEANRHNPEGFYEDTRLQRLCIRAFKDRMACRIPREELVTELTSWRMWRESHVRYLGAKHPSLCMCVAECECAWGEETLYVAVHRDVPDIVRSWRQTGWAPRESRKIATIAKAHLMARDLDLLTIPRERVMHLPFALVKEHPVDVVMELASFAKVECGHRTAEEIARHVYQKRPGHK